MSETHSAFIRGFHKYDRSTAITRCLARGREPYSVYAFFAQFSDVDDWAEIHLNVESLIGDDHVSWHEEFLLQLLDSGVVHSDYNDVADYRETPLGEYYGDAYLQDLKLRDFTTALYILELDFDAADEMSYYEAAVMIPREFVPGLSRSRTWAAATGSRDNFYRLFGRHDRLRRRRRRGHALISWGQLSAAYLPRQHVQYIDDGDTKVMPPAQPDDEPPYPVATPPEKVRGLDVVDETTALTVTDRQVIECDLDTHECRTLAEMDDEYLALQDVLRVDDDRLLITSYEPKTGYKKGLIHFGDGGVREIETKRSLGNVRPERVRRLSDGRLLVWGARALVRDGDETTVFDDELPGRDLHCVSEGPDGEFWAIGAKKGYVSRFVEGGGEPLQFRRRKHGLPSEPVSLTVRPGGNAWLFALDGIYILDRAGGVERHDALSDWAVNPLIAGWFIDEKRGWFLNDCGQLVYLEDGSLPRLFTWQHLEGVPVPAPKHSYYTPDDTTRHMAIARRYRPELTMDSRGGLWFVIGGGLFYISPDDLDAMLDGPEINIGDVDDLATEPVSFPGAEAGGDGQPAGPTMPSVGNRRFRHFEKLSRFNRRQRADELFLGTPIRRLPPELLALHGVDELTAREADEIAGWKGPRLALPDLASLDDDGATGLAGWSGKQLELGVTELTPELVRALMSWEGQKKKSLAFNALCTLTPACAAEFEAAGREYEKLVFSALDTLDAETLEQLLDGWTAKSSLILGDVGELTPRKAAELGAAEGIEGVELLGVTRALTADAATELAEFGGRILHIEGIDNLAADAAAKLSDWNRGHSGVRESTLRLDGTFELTADSASHLAECECVKLVLSPGEPLSPAVVDELTDWEGTRMDLSAGGKSLHTESAALLANWEPTPPSATVSMRSELHLRNFERIDSNAAAELAEWSGDMLAIHAPDIGTDALQALTDWNGKILVLDGLETLTPETAQILTGWHGQGLALGGIESLDADTAGALAEFPGPGLMLNGLKQLDTETAARLANWDGMQLVLRSLHNLKREVAEKLADCQAATLAFNETSQLSNLEIDADAILAATGFPPDEK